MDYDLEYHLLNGMNWFGGFNGDLDSFAAAWEMHGERLLAEFIAERPGERPFAWWLLEHKQERPLVRDVAGDVECIRNDTRHGDQFGFLHTDFIPPLQQPQTEYLDEHDLLTDAERELLFGDDDNQHDGGETTKQR